MLAGDIAVRIRKLEERFPISQIVVDTGGYGKGISEELKRTHGIQCIPAEKTKKAAYIEALNSDLMSGIVQIVAGGNRPLVDELILLQWDEDSMRTGKPKEDPRYSNHLCDAMLYAWRMCFHHSEDWEELPPPVGSPQWEELERAKMWDKIKADIRKREEEPWYL